LRHKDFIAFWYCCCCSY